MGWNPGANRRFSEGVHVSLTRDQHRKLDAIALMTGRKKAAIMRQAISRLLREWDAGSWRGEVNPEEPD